MNQLKFQFILVIFHLLFVFTSHVQAQKHQHLLIKKNDGLKLRSINLPVNCRIITIEENIVYLKIDSISNGKIYGNKGKDSLNLDLVKCIHTRGIKEFIKFTALTGSSAYMAGLLIFSVYALNYPIFKDSPNGNIAYVGLAFTGFFAGLSTLIYHYPRTRFPSKKFHFKTE